MIVCGEFRGDFCSCIVVVRSPLIKESINNESAGVNTLRGKEGQR